MRGIGGKSPWLVYLYLAPAVLGVGVLALGLVYLADASLHLLDRRTFLPGEDYTLANYQTLWERSVYGVVLLRSLGAAAVVTLFTLVLALPYAYALVRTSSPRVRRLLLLALFTPFFIGQVVRAYGWLVVLGQQGLLNASLGLVGLGPVDILYTFTAVVVGLVQYMLPFAVLMLTPALTAIPVELERASAAAGAHPWATLGLVILPLASPGLVAAGVVVFTLTLTDFAMPEILGGGTQDFVANAIYDGFFAVSDAGLGSALAMVLVALGSVLVAVMLLATGRMVR
ncbi:MAG: ABC transporter permease [Candidatus Competibacterales bacterium]